MSRSFGSRSLTTLSPMRSSPDEIDSSPAIIRSAVDLPQPDGPTSTRNSPSATSSESLCTAWKPFSYTLSIALSVMLPTSAPLPLTVPDPQLLPTTSSPLGCRLLWYPSESSMRFHTISKGNASKRRRWVAPAGTCRSQRVRRVLLLGGVYEIRNACRDNRGHHVVGAR